MVRENGVIVKKVNAITTKSHGVGRRQMLEQMFKHISIKTTSLKVMAFQRERSRRRRCKRDQKLKGIRGRKC